MSSVSNKSLIKNHILEFFALMLIAFCVELFIFQFRVWQDLDNEAILVPLAIGDYSKGTTIDDNGTVTFDQKNGNCLVTFDLRSLNHLEIHNIAISAFSPDGEAYWDDFEGNTYACLRSRMVKVRMVLTEGEQNVLLEPGAIGANSISFDIISFPSGSSPELITIQFQSIMGEKIVLSGIKLNAQRKISFSLSRYFGILTIMLLIRCLGPKSKLWNIRLFEIKLQKRIFAEVFFGLVFAWLIYGFLLRNPVYIQGEGGFTPYRELAHALSRGQTWIDEMPSKELLEMDDPYSFMERMESGVKYKLDYALYEGKYYVYFGIVPCLIFFMPLYMAAGIDIPGWCVIAVLLLLLYIGTGGLIKVLADRYCRNISIAVYVFLRIGILAVLSLPAIVSDPNAYYIPMLSAVVFYVFGLWCYIKAAQAIDAEHKELGWIVSGSIMMAFVAGSRPQLVVAAIIVLPLLFRYLFQKNERGIEIQWRRFWAFLVPYIVVAIGLMYYNMIRFGSPFDFGAAYNLTFANTYYWEFHIEAVGAGILYYLFRIPRFMATAPFLQMTHLDWTNPGLLANHTSTGGIYALYPILWIAVLVFVTKNDTNGRQKELRRMGVLWLALTVFMAALTAVAGGLMDRYRMDFAIFAALAYVAGAINYVANCAGKKAISEEKTKIWGKREWLRLLALVLTVMAILTAMLTYFEEGVWWIADANPEWYTKLVNTIAFWN